MKTFYSIILMIIIQSSQCLSQTIINDYHKVTAVGTASAVVTDLAGIQGNHTLAVDDTVLIIQMQGATINETNTAAFGTPTINNAGNYEINVICHIDVPSKTVHFKYNLVRAYTPATGSVQIVTHGDGRATNVTVTGTLTCRPWDGDFGGVVFLKAYGTLTLGGNIDVSQRGFRGGAVGGIVGLPGAVCNKNVLTAGGDFLWNNGGCNGATTNISATGYYYPKFSLGIPAPNHVSPPAPATAPANLLDQYVGAWKGEGIAQYILDKETGRGPQANGGGGGQTHNSGGGGGGNYGDGGIGGKPWDGATIVDGGMGGKAIGYTGGPNLAPNKIFMGGGGGGGHGNYPNGTPSPGGNGGGIVIIKCINFTVTGARSISSNGENNVPNLDGDSEGGGGAAGTVYMDVSGTITSAATLTFNLRGGKGGDAINSGDCIGTGGGGSGGFIYSSVSLAGSVKNLNGGANGVVTGVLVGKPCENSATGDPSWGALPGANGSFLDNQTSYRIAQGTVEANCALPVEMLSFSAVKKNDFVQLKWATASELNNSYFLIERSADGVVFETVARVDGAGNSSSISYYQWTDDDPLKGTSYYRLKQVDTDGVYNYKGVTSVNSESSEFLLSVLPQPVEGTRTITVRYTMNADSPVNIRLVDGIGREAGRWTLDAVKGNNESIINLQNVSAGLHFIYISGGDRLDSEKIIIK